MKLIIGNKSYSSWSLRPWVLMKHFHLPFEEILIKLDMPETTENIKKYSPHGKVPALIDGDFAIWESVAIMEYLNEKFPEKKMYPQDQRERALARALTMEMHSGFFQLREVLSFNLKKNYESFDVGLAAKDIQRIKEIWTERLESSGGPFLFGDFTIADAMFAPVCSRFKTYAVPVENEVKSYCEAILNLPAMKNWYSEGLQEKFTAPFHK